MSRGKEEPGIATRFTKEQVLSQPLADHIFRLTRRYCAARFYHERLTPCPQ